jgi:hypothetical protein
MRTYKEQLARNKDVLRQSGVDGQQPVRGCDRGTVCPLVNDFDIGLWLHRAGEFATTREFLEIAELQCGPVAALFAVARGLIDRLAPPLPSPACGRGESSV